MIKDPEQLLEDFFKTTGERTPITHRSLPAPHDIPRLPEGFGAVYVFSLSESYGATVPAGQHRALKVGLTRSPGRFSSAHYNGGARSCMTYSLFYEKQLWAKLGISEPFNQQSPGPWLQENTDRDHFLLPVGYYDTVLGRLERFVIAQLDPMFEGLDILRVGSEGKKAPCPVPREGEIVITMPWELFDAVAEAAEDDLTEPPSPEFIRSVQTVGGFTDRGYREVAVGPTAARTWFELIPSSCDGSTPHGRSPVAGRRICQKIADHFGFTTKSRQV